MHAMTRRHALRGLGAIAAGVTAWPVSSRTPPTLQIGLELYMVADALEKDFEGTLRQVAAIGYRDVELSQFFGRTPRALRTQFDAAGLRCRSVHLLPVRLRPGEMSLLDDAGAIRDACGELGARDVVCPIPSLSAELLQDYAKAKPTADGFRQLLAGLTHADWMRHAQFLNRTGERLHRLNLRLAHHNHNLEFREFNGVPVLEDLLKETDPRYVALELDCGWVAAAGHDPVDLLHRHGSRIPLLHFKDLTRRGIPNFALTMESVDCGQGIIDWPALLAAARQAEVRCAFVEQEPPFARSTVESARASLEFLRKMAT